MTRFFVIAAMAVSPYALAAQTADMSGAIDYDALFEANTDTVETLSEAPVRQRLQLGDIVIMADQSGDTIRYVAMDRAETVAVGCLWEMYVEVAQLAQSCPAMLDDDQSARLDAHVDAIGNFVADNTYPPVPREDFWAHWRAEFEQPSASECITLDQSAGPAQFVAYLVSPQITGQLARVLSTPRLPVSQPCF